MAEIDNICFNVGLSERVRARAEVHGRVELEVDQITTLVRSKVAHILFLVVVFLLVVALKADSEPWYTSVALLFAGQVEAVATVPRANAQESLKRMGMALTEAFVGMCTFGAVFGLARSS